MWYRKDILIVLYVDDCGIAFQSQKVLDDFIAALRAKNFKLTVEESFNEFLGIQYTSLPDGSVECTQEGLISKIIDATGLKDANPNKVPAASDTLGTDPDGFPSLLLGVTLVLLVCFCISLPTLVLILPLPSVKLLDLPTTPRNLMQLQLR